MVRMVGPSQSLADYRRWLAEYQMQLGVDTHAHPINLAQGDTADDPIEL